MVPQLQQQDHQPHQPQPLSPEQEMGQTKTIPVPTARLPALPQTFNGKEGERQEQRRRSSLPNPRHCPVHSVCGLYSGPSPSPSHQSQQPVWFSCIQDPRGERFAEEIGNES